MAQSHSSSTMDTSLDSATARKHLKMLKEDPDQAPTNSNLHQSSPSPSYSPAMSPYMQSHSHYRQYEQQQHMPGGGGGGGSFESGSGMKRPLRSPNEMMQESLRESVLRDGSKAGRPGSPPDHMNLSYRPSSSSGCPLPQQPEGDGARDNRFESDQPATALRCPESNNAERCRDPGCPEGKSFKRNT